jgi:hypothetical protein
MSSQDASAADDTPFPLASRLWWMVPAVGLVLLAFVAMIFGGGREKVGFGTSYDASDKGFRGVYLVLEELGYPVERSRRPSGGEVRWILFPSKTSAREAHAVDDWVQRGGCALLALDDTEFADQIGLSVKVTNGSPPKTTDDPFQNMRPTKMEKGEPHEVIAPDVTRVFAGRLEVKGPAGGEIWGRIEDQPLVTIYKRGRGELWLLSRPDVLANANLREGDNAVLACRLAEAMLAERPRGRLAFDEYCHGLQDRPDVFQLLFKPPVLAVTLEALFLTGLILWHFCVRFGSLRRTPPPPRRSKEEFLDAMAELLTRKGDRAEAFRTVRDEFIRRLEEDLGLPAGTPIEQTVREAVRRRGIQLEPLLRLLTAPAPPQGAGAGAFLDALHQLEIAANECFQSRPNTR